LPTTAASLPRLIALAALAVTAPVLAQRPAAAPKVTQPAQVPALSSPLVVEGAWVRALPGASVGAAYMTLRNVSSHPVTVLAIESPLAAQAMIHETKVENGQSRMRPHEEVLVDAGQSVKLAPGGLHVMLHGLPPLSVGQSVPLTIILEDGRKVQVAATVRPLTAR